MERTKRDLESVVNSQKDQLSRYEKRLKDVVTAYKGLLKEKEALETSLAAITSQKDEAMTAKNNDNISDTTEKPNSETTSVSDADDEAAVSEKSNIQSQIATLMNSLATLSAEKSRMEQSFQADKKQLRSQLLQKDQTIIDLQNRLQESKERAKAEVDEVKAKWIIERQEREKETNNQMLMIRELQKLYADERHLKENIEMQLNNFKTNFASNEAEHSRVGELQAQLKDVKAQLKQMHAEKGLSDTKTTHNSAILLKQLQQEMHQLKEQHAVAIKSEQRRVQLAEEQSRKQAVLHEDRVANLEARLAELSKTVGNYDRLRQQDQDSIHVLKRQLQDLERTTNESCSARQNIIPENIGQRLPATDTDMGHIVDEIIRLKKIILKENGRSANPIDLTNIFSVGADHAQCQQELNASYKLLEVANSEINQLKEKVSQQKSHISTLQDKVKVLNRNIDEQELELKHYNEKLQLSLKEERAKWKSLQSEMENDYRCKLNEMEQQLQKQRQRSLQLLDEKEQEIKALQTSFEIFHASNNSGTNSLMANDVPSGSVVSSDAESNDEIAASVRKVSLKAKKLSMGESFHMLHYANEIARKDIEITNLRKARYQAETAMRKAIHDKVTSQEELNDKLAVLEEQVDRLERCKTREGANLEYLKNVIISYIVSKDADGKRHMMNAISAVLQFTSAEMQIINASLQKK
ncbi:GRIP and coiled-coil domain-containing protein 1 [Stomoxys calcitrans]|uniref:GRIP and coiled-coil domain-containing protein 1 n=1 Tax=Stomoxys calcitrans TaxID=35570 RepID=UPI0027E33B88|nr:GRIP and coiled-coil domain-containing protein 1 [Stomoxys calcitrans]